MCLPQPVLPVGQHIQACFSSPPLKLSIQRHSFPLFTFALRRKQSVDFRDLNLPLKWGFYFSHPCCQLFHSGRLGTFASPTRRTNGFSMEMKFFIFVIPKMYAWKGMLCSADTSFTDASLHPCYWSWTLFFLFFYVDTHNMTSSRIGNLPTCW